MCRTFPISDFEDMSCEMIFGQNPFPPTEDPVFKQACYRQCKVFDNFALLIHICLQKISLINLNEKKSHISTCELYRQRKTKTQHKMFQLMQEEFANRRTWGSIECNYKE